MMADDNGDAGEYFIVDPLARRKGKPPKVVMPLDALAALSANADEFEREKPAKKVAKKRRKAV